jgi:nitroreductase
METIKAIAKRKTTRKYLQRQIAQNELETILFAGCAAPVAGNDWHTMQLVERFHNNIAILDDRN